MSGLEELARLINSEAGDELVILRNQDGKPDASEERETREARMVLEHIDKACKVRKQSLEEMLNNFEESAYNYARALREVISQAEEALKGQEQDRQETAESP